MNKNTIDLRTLCKYGEKCYQKNSLHLKRFKHPQKIEEKEKEDESPPLKKMKPNESCTLAASSKEFTEKVEEKEISDKEEDADTNTEEDEVHTDNELLTESPKTSEESIKQKFLVDMPKDFYDFWEFCKSLNNKNPEDALADIGLKLVGPFEVLSGNLKENKRLYQYLCHWRFYYDPPEFQTILIGNKNEYHIGYFRDDPADEPVFLASLSSSKPGVITIMKEDLFATVDSFINSTFCNAKEPKKEQVLAKLDLFAKEKGYILKKEASNRLKERRKLVVSKTFHGAGLVVPFDKVRDVGYREIPETTASLKKIMKSIDEAPTKEKENKSMEALHELITNVQFANDEGDSGMGLELGLDLFTYGSPKFHSSIRHLLTVAYDLLNRKPFAKIIKAHLKNRRKGPNMNTFDVDANHVTSNS